MKIDDIILQYSTRGMHKIKKAYPKEYCKDAVNHFVSLEKGTVFLYTGFWVDGFAETDGPIGTYFLALALNKIGYKAVIISDEFCKDYFKSIKTIYIPLKGYTSHKYEEILNTYNPICHISIERCGKNINEKYENAKSIDISKHTSPLDELFLKASTPTFAIGDGGNEIGMGNFKDFIKNELNITPCKIKCDFPIIASVSNWGAYGFIAYLQKYYKIQIMPSFKEVDEYLEFIVNLGALDGIKKQNIKSVDGKDWLIEKEILQALNVYKTTAQ